MPPKLDISRDISNKETRQSSRHGQTSLPGETAEQAAAAQTGPAYLPSQAAFTDALARLEYAQEQLTQSKHKFDAEVQRITTQFNQSTADLGTSIQTIKSYEARLHVVEQATGRIPELEERIQNLSDENDALKVENSQISGSLEEEVRKFEKFRSRPDKFMYNRTIVCNNVHMSSVDETRETQLEIADKILRYGFLMDPPPLVVDVARLPFNVEKFGDGLIPGFKIELENEQTRRLVLSKARNLAAGAYAPLSVRRSMSEGERSSISAYRQMSAVLTKQGIQGLPVMMPSGNIKRPWTGTNYGNFGYGNGYGHQQQQQPHGFAGLFSGAPPSALHAAPAPAPSTAAAPVGPIDPAASAQPAAMAQPVAHLPQRVNNFLGRQRRPALNVMEIN
jgi:regulator of replication initiation timing